jgi:VIT family
VSVGSPEKRERVLDPIERLSEVLFGLIMVLSFTLSISAATSGNEEVRTVVVGAVGCNLAWGIVDAVMYLLAILFERGRGLTIGRAVRATSDPERGRELLAEALPQPLDQLFEGPALEQARAKLVAMPKIRERPHLTGSDWSGAIGVFFLVFLSTFPVVVPFLVFSPVHRALRISNGVAIAMLYVAGHMLGKYAGLKPFLMGLVMVAIGILLVGVTMALGG